MFKKLEKTIFSKSYTVLFLIYLRLCRSDTAFCMYQIYKEEVIIVGVFSDEELLFIYETLTQGGCSFIQKEDVFYVKESVIIPSQERQFI